MIDKIFDEETVQYLMDAGVSKKHINEIRHKKYKEGMLLIAKKLVKAIEEEDISLIKDYIENSPAGDGWGCDNDFLDFSSIDADNTYAVDVSDAFGHLKTLKQNI